MFPLVTYFRFQPILLNKRNSFELWKLPKFNGFEEKFFRSIEQ